MKSGFALFVEDHAFGMEGMKNEGDGHVVNGIDKALSRLAFHRRGKAIFVSTQSSHTIREQNRYKVAPCV